MTVRHKTAKTWKDIEKYCPKCKKVYSWSYSKCKKCGSVLSSRVKRKL